MIPLFMDDYETPISISGELKYPFIAIISRDTLT